MKIIFEDDSFLQIEESTKEDKAASVVMCGFNPYTKKLIMSSSELDTQQVQDLINFLEQKILKTVP